MDGKLGEMSSVPRHRRLLYLAFSVIPLLLLLASVEIGLRVYDWSRGTSAHGRAFWYWGFVQDPLMGYRSRPNLDIVLSGGNHLDTNGQGFRDLDLAIRPAAPRRLIVCMGESSTWGIGSSNRATTWPHQLHQVLNGTDPRLVAFNAGMPGYSLVENLPLLNYRLLKYRPEAVVYMGFRNDVEFYMRGLTDETDVNFYSRRLAPLPATFLSNLFLRSSVVALIASRLGNAVKLDQQTGVTEHQAGQEITPRGEELFRDQIALMKRLCDRHHVKLLWVDQPLDYAKRGTAATGLKAAREILRDELSQQGIPLLKAHAIYDYQHFPMIDDVHFNDAGNKHLASILAPQILAELNKPAL